MDLHALALDWSLDGPVGAGFLTLVVVAAVVYVAAAQRGRRRDRRGRRWPRSRTASFLAGLAVLVVDLYSGIGSQADVWLSVHMVEHMVMWVVVAPLLVAGAPIRLALYSLSPGGRRRLGRWLHSRPVALATSPVGGVSLFSAAVLITHIPAVYGLALTNDYVHEAEHALYLLTAVLVWAPLLGVDPLPHRPGVTGRLACMVACMLPMVLIAVWLGSASHPVYVHYTEAVGSSALDDQRLAATIMWAGGLAAFGVPAADLLRALRRRRARVERADRASAPLAVGGRGASAP